MARTQRLSDDDLVHREARQLARCRGLDEVHSGDVDELGLNLGEDEGHDHDWRFDGRSDIDGSKNDIRSDGDLLTGAGGGIAVISRREKRFVAEHGAVIRQIDVGIYSAFESVNGSVGNRV